MEMGYVAQAVAGRDVHPGVLVSDFPMDRTINPDASLAARRQGRDPCGEGQMADLEGRIKGSLNLEDIEAVTVPPSCPPGVLQMLKDRGIPAHLRTQPDGPPHF